MLCCCMFLQNRPNRTETLQWEFIWFSSDVHFYINSLYLLDSCTFNLNKCQETLLLVHCASKYVSGNVVSLFINMVHIRSRIHGESDNL